MEDIRIVLEPRTSCADVDFPRDGLSPFNVAAIGHAYYSPLALFFRDGQEAIPGGAYGHVWGGWLDLFLLWVAEPLRGRGYSRELLEAAEDEGRRRGCRGVFLSTFSFQARAFYERSVYEVAVDVPDYLAEHTHHVLKKTLRGG